MCSLFSKDSLHTKLLRLFALSLSLPNLTSSGETNLLGVWTADKPFGQQTNLLDSRQSASNPPSDCKQERTHVQPCWVLADAHFVTLAQHFLPFCSSQVVDNWKGLALKILLPSIRAINNSLLKATLHTWFNLVFTLFLDTVEEREKSIGFVEISQLYATPSCTPSPIFGILSPQLNSAEQLNHEVKRKSQNPPQKIWDPPSLYRP